jgi:hypothetical protein
MRVSPARGSALPYIAAAAAGAVIGVLLGDDIRMTVPHGCKAGCGPDYGIKGATAGAVWAVLAAIFVASMRRGWKPRIGAAAVILLLVLFTLLEPK